MVLTSKLNAFDSLSQSLFLGQSLGIFHREQGLSILHLTFYSLLKSLDLKNAFTFQKSHFVSQKELGSTICDFHIKIFQKGWGKETFLFTLKKMKMVGNYSPDNTLPLGQKFSFQTILRVEDLWKLKGKNTQINM